MKLSSQEKECSLTLSRWGIKHEMQYRIPAVKKRVYDCHFVYNNTHYLVELDGKQHFEDVTYFGTTAHEQHMNDCMKQFVAIVLGFRMIRIHHDDNVATTLMVALNSPHYIIYSNPNAYQFMRTYLRIHVMTLKGFPRIPLVRKYIRKGNVDDFLCLCRKQGVIDYCLGIF